MQGRRVEHEPHLYEPGDYGRWGYEWYGLPPGFDGLANLTAHKVEEHADGTITVSPSILVKGGPGEAQWHGYLEHGVWREC